MQNLDSQDLTTLLKDRNAKRERRQVFDFSTEGEYKAQLAGQNAMRWGDRAADEACMVTLHRAEAY